MTGGYDEGDIIQFEGETDLYQVILEEPTGQVFARRCFNDTRYSIIPSELSREVKGKVKMIHKRGGEFY
jgi:uncharacterized protein (DUF1330 family)